MLQSKLFGKTLREPPKDETSINARFLMQAGYIEKLMAGVYSYLPLGLRVLKNIEQIIREEMQAIDGQELLMPALHPKEPWETSGRWELYNKEHVMYQFTDFTGRAFGLGPTHEEIVTPLAKRDILSYRDLPLALYQFQTKFRSELRAKSGLLRGREFLMKDLYSFHATEDDLVEYYERAKGAYKKIFDRVGLGEKTLLTFASGGSFSKYSHEFQTLTPAGEDTIYVCPSCRIAINDEIITEQATCPECGKPRDELTVERAIEVGNIFPLKTKYSEAFHLTFKDQQGKEQPVMMGCYGIGLGRVLGAIVEVHHDDSGIIWPIAVAPYAVHLIRLGDDDDVRKHCDALYKELAAAQISVLYDDREASAGVKLADADLLGIPVRLVVSKKTIAAGGVEWKERRTGEVKQVKDVVKEVKGSL